MTTFDRYLLSRYCHVVAVFLVATLGLFTVVDGFMHLDDFQLATENQGLARLFLMMAQHYVYQSASIVDLAGPTILVISSMSALALMLKNGEIHPVLAAGVPTYRLTRPLVGGLVTMNILLAINQEVILPRIAPQLQRRHGDTEHDAQSVVPTQDPKWRIFISGQGVVPGEKKLIRPEFALPAPALAEAMVTLKGDEAYYFSASGEDPAGWLVHNIHPSLNALALTPLGRQVIIPQRDERNVFIASTLSITQLSRQASKLQLLSTRDLFHRLQQPTGSILSRRALLVHLHNRLTRPLLTLVGLFLVIPLIIRREKMNAMQQVTNIAVCAAVLGVVFGMSLGCQFLGTSGVLSPEQSVWAPLVLGGGIAAWLTGIVRT